MTQDGHWPLFREAPALREPLAPISLCSLPTPVEALPGLGPHAWIKRDDQSHPVYGGNKMRKLEFVGAAVLRAQAREVVTFGATGTNSGVAMALFCHWHGMRCQLLSFPQPDSAVVQANQAALSTLGARQHRFGSLLSAALAWYLHPRRLDPRTAFVFAGCSDPVSVYAYVNAALELHEQIERGECPAPAEIIVAAGSASTLAGLALGCALAGLDARVRGIRVAPTRVGPIDACTASVVRGLMRGPARALGVRGEIAFTLDDDWFGPGYGHATTDATEAIATARDAGLVLEGTYTGKAFAAFLHRLRTSTGPVLFWNTFSPHPPRLS